MVETLSMRVNRHQILGEPGAAHCYHVVSRIIERRLVLGDEEREFLLGLLGRQLRFSGLECLAYCFMGNHFHLLLRVPDKEAALAGWGEDDFLGRLERLDSEPYTRKLLADVKMWRENGSEHAVAKLAGAVRARLFDLPAFMKEFKHKFSLWFNKRRGRRGPLWEDRYRAVRVEGTGGLSPDGPSALLAVAAYIDLNPVRAGLCDDPKDYRWCSYAAAVAGGKAARRGIAACLGAQGDTGRAAHRAQHWARHAKRYRLLLFGVGEHREGGDTPGGRTKRRRGFTQAQIDAVIARGGKLTVAEALRCRLKHFTRGLVLGSRSFLRSSLPSGARPPHEITGVDWGGLAVAGRPRGPSVQKSAS